MGQARKSVEAEAVAVSFLELREASALVRMGGGAEVSKEPGGCGGHLKLPRIPPGGKPPGQGRDRTLWISSCSSSAVCSVSVGGEGRGRSVVAQQPGCPP